MDPIRLVERVDPPNAREQERHQHSIVLLRNLRIHPPERRRVRGAEVGRRLHADDHDAGRGMRGTHRVDDALQVRSQRIDVECAETVVRADLEHYDVRRLAHHPSDAAQGTGGRLPADACVDHVIA